MNGCSRRLDRLSCDLFRWDCGPGYGVAFSTRVGGRQRRAVRVAEPRQAHARPRGARRGEPSPALRGGRRRRREACAEPPAALGRSSTGRRQGSRGEPGDGLWTDEPGVPMLKLTADCVPIALARRGSPRARRAPRWLARAAGGDRRGRGRCRSAGRCAPPSGRRSDPAATRSARRWPSRSGVASAPTSLTNRMLDLWTAAERALRQAGVTKVERFDVCTSCNPELFFSHRRDDRRHRTSGCDRRCCRLRRSGGATTRSAPTPARE